MNNKNQQMKKINIPYLEIGFFVAILIAICYSFSSLCCYWPYLPIQLVDLTYAVAVSIIAAYIFYWFQVKVPENTVKKNYRDYVDFFKGDIIQDILDIAYHDMIQNKQYDSLEIDNEIQQGLQCSQNLLLPNQKHIMSVIAPKLKSEKEFRNFFKLKAGEGQTMWNRFQNGLNKSSIKQILERLELLREETRFLLIKTSVSEPTLKYLKNLSETIYRVKYHDYKQEDIRVLTDLLWTMMTGWSFSEGYNEKGSIVNIAKNI